MFETIVTNFTLEKILYIIKKRVIFMIIAGIIGSVSAGIYATKTNYSTYCAAISFYIYSNPDYISDSSVNISTSELNSAMSLKKSYTFVIKSNKVLDRINKELKLPYTRDELSSMIASSNVPETAVFYIYVYNKDPQEALLIANAIADIAPAEITRVVKSGGVEVIDYADEPTNVYYANNVMKYILLGGILGFGLLFVIFLVKGLLDTTIRTEKDILDTFTIPILGDVPNMANKKIQKNELLVNEDSTFLMKESYLGICANLLYTGKNEKCPVYVVTSANRDEGKTVISINIARSFEKIGKKVLVIDADLRRPSVSAYINHSIENGLSQYLAGIADKIDLSYDNDVAYIESGNVPPNPMELLASDRLADLVVAMKDKFDYIIIDMPPVGIVSDALLLKDIVTKYILIARSNKSKLTDAKSMVSAFEEIDADICGFVLNGVSLKTKKDKKYYGKEDY